MGWGGRPQELIASLLGSMTDVWVLFGPEPVCLSEFRPEDDGIHPVTVACSIRLLE